MKFFSFVQSADKIPCVWCGYGGATIKTAYKFSVSDIPPRCELIVYGMEYFNTEPSAEDTAAIKALIAAKKTVFMYFSSREDVDWNGIMNAKDDSSLDQQIAPMIKYLNTNKVNGVILSYLSLLAGEIPDYATKINGLICKIKAGVPSIKVALLVSGWMADSFGDKKLFDFTVTNDAVDYYVIDTTTAASNCTGTTTANGGRFPITSTDKTQVTIDQISKATKSSPMCQDKLIIYFADYVSKGGDGSGTISYAEYCSKPGSGVLCPDTMQLFYDNVKHVKSVFKGILISDLDQDDYDNACSCGKFSVANTYIDAWEGKPITCCPKI